MEGISRKAIGVAVAVAIFSVYLKLTGTKILKNEAEVLLYTAYLSSGRTAQDAFILYAGRVVFFVIVAVWLGIIGQATVAAIKRYRRPLAVLPPLQPLAEDERHQLAAQQQQQPLLSAAADPNSISPQQQQQQQQEQSQQRSSRVSDLDERRQRALDALQRDLAAKAAALKEQQMQEEAQRAARQAAAAQAAAQKAAQAAAAAEAARAAEARQWDQWERSVMRAWGSSSNLEAAAGAGSSGGGAAAVETLIGEQQQVLQANRQLREEQDAEYHASLAADRQKRQQRQQQELLRKLKKALQQQLPPEAAASSDNGGLTIRVRLPDGTSAVRYFAPSQGFSDVQDWVFSLPAMPLWAPGSWQLGSSFPKRILQASAGIWAPGGYSSRTLDNYISAMVGAGPGSPDAGWSLMVRLLDGAELSVQVHGEMTVLQVKEKVEQQTGLPPDHQHLIFAGQLLSDTSTLQQYNITAEHRLQLMPRMGATPTLPAAATGEEDAAAAASAADGDDEGVLVVSDVQQLKDDVAHGASQLALYVVGGGN